MDRTAAELAKAMEAILANAENDGNRNLTDDEIAEFDELQAQHEAAVEAESDADEQRSAETTARRDALASARRAATHAAQASRPVTQLAGVRRPDEARREFETLAEFCEAAVFRPNDQRLEFQNVDPRAEQSMATGSEGGFLIPKQFSQEIQRVMGASALVRPRARVIPAGSPPDAEFTMPALDQRSSVSNNVYAGVSVSWVAEGGAKPETDFDLRELSLKPNEVAGHIKLTDKSMRNSAAIGALVADLLPAAIAKAEDDAAINGNGVGKPLGYIQSGAAYVETRNTNSSVDYDDLVQMLSRTLGDDSNYVWVATPALKPILMKIQDASGGSPGVGQYIWQQSLVAGEPSTLLGVPVIFHERAPAVGSKGDLSLVDLSYYLIKDGSGPFLVSDGGIVNFTTNKTLIKAFTNVDGQPWLTEPFQHEDGRQYSPFVVLAANT